MDRRAVEAAAALGIIPRRTRTKVKIFSGNWTSGLEQVINDWLEAQPADFRLIDIKYSTDGSQSKTSHSALVIYTVLEPLEDEGEVQNND